MEQASHTLHPLRGCVRCGDNLCERMGVSAVPLSFVQERAVGADFECSMLPGPRMRRRRHGNHATNASFYFQMSPATALVHAVPSCGACPGAPCAEGALVDASDEYWATLSVAPTPFECAMASGTVGGYYY